MLIARLLVCVAPAAKAANIPEARLEGEKEPREKPIIPPRNVDSVPMYGPRSIPMMGAIIAAAVIAWPDRPIIGEIFRKPKTTYKAVNVTLRAVSFVLSLWMSMLWSFRVFGNLIILSRL